MKITAKTTKRELKDVLNMNVKAVQEKDTNLYERILYTAKMSKEDDSKVKKTDLMDLVKEVQRVLADSFVEPTVKEETPTTETPSVEPKAENSTKKKLHKKSEKVETPTEEQAPTETPTEEPKAEEPKTEKVDKKKSANKSSNKLNKKKEEPKKDDDTASQKKETVQPIFPQTLRVGVGEDTKEYRLAPEIKTMDDLYEATVDKDMDEVLFAYHWTRKQLKKEPYFNNLLGKFTSFENDLDLAGTLYVSEERKVAYHISLYTEGCYNTLPEDFEDIDGVRYAGDAEFQIYRRV